MRRQMQPQRRTMSMLGLAITLPLTLTLSLAGCGGDGRATQPVSDIVTLSGRPDMVAGDDVLVEVRPAPDQKPAEIRVMLNSTTDVTSVFQSRTDGRLIGLVKGLRLGSNTLSAKYQDGPALVLAITSFPKGGPIFSGPQLQPWICETEKAGLGPAIDSQCNVAAPKIEYFYRSSDRSKTSLLNYDPAKPPSDLANTTLENGAVVPFIVRRESGTLNRGIYSFAVIASPTEASNPAIESKIWNGALWYIFQGGYVSQYRQGPVGGVFGDQGDPRSLILGAIPALSKGYAVASSTLNVFGQNTNSVVSAETTLMVKQRVSKALGEIKMTIATGASGGSMQQNLIVNAYPGILDGINPSLTFPDAWSTHTELADCSLMTNYFDKKKNLWPDVAQQNVAMDNANQSPGTCRSWTNRGLAESSDVPSSTSCFVEDLTFGVRSGLLPWMYSSSNPAGARCTLQDYAKNIFGVRGNGFANRPYDNVGIEYGLKALKVGAISVEQFLDLNESIGGKDIDGNFVAGRTAADPDALSAIYRSGQYNLLNNTTVPILDTKLCFNTEIHSCYNSFRLRERLRKASGSAANHALLLDFPDTAGSPLALDMLSKWVRSLKADTSAASSAEKVAKNRPAEAADACWVSGQRVTDAATCASAKPFFGEPRTGAGAPITGTAVKCQLSPPNRSSYGVTLTDAQWARLQAAFPQGVCDWAKPGVGETANIPWLSYAAGPGGQPIPAPPGPKLSP